MPFLGRGRHPPQSSLCSLLWRRLHFWFTMTAGLLGRMTTELLLPRAQRDGGRIEEDLPCKGVFLLECSASGTSRSIHSTWLHRWIHLEWASVWLHFWDRLSPYPSSLFMYTHIWLTVSPVSPFFLFVCLFCSSTIFQFFLFFSFFLITRVLFMIFFTFSSCSPLILTCRFATICLQIHLDCPLPRQKCLAPLAQFSKI